MSQRHVNDATPCLRSKHCCTTGPSETAQITMSMILTILAVEDVHFVLVCLKLEDLRMEHMQPICLFDESVYAGISNGPFMLIVVYYK